MLLSIARSIAQSSDPEMAADVRVFYVAINTLVASRKHGGVVRLMEMICAPKDDEARVIRSQFVAQEFMKKAYMKHVLGPVEFDDEDLTQRGFCPQECAVQSFSIGIHLNACSMRRDLLEDCLIILDVAATYLLLLRRSCDARRNFHLSIFFTSARWR